MPNLLLLFVGVVAGGLMGAALGYYWVSIRNRQDVAASSVVREKLLADAETQKKEMVLEAKEEAHRIRMILEQEVRDASAELQSSGRSEQQNVESIDRK